MTNNVIGHDYICHVEDFSTYIRSVRIAAELSSKQVAQALGIDVSLISRFEQGKRNPTKEQVIKIAQLINLDEQDLLKRWYAEQVVKMVTYGDISAKDVLMMAESRIAYLSSSKVKMIPVLKEGVLGKLKELDVLKAKLNQRRPLSGMTLAKMLEYFKTNYTYESNRIEGNTLTLQETALVINEGITISGKSVTEHLETINHAEAIDLLRDFASDEVSFNKRTLSDFHNMILRGIDRDNAGRYRSVPVRISGSQHVPPQPYLIDKLMEDYFKYYDTIKDKVHPVILAAEMHERLVSIHPFIDGNGRTSRLVMNLILLSNGYTIANLKGGYDDRMRYYQALESVQLNADPEPFHDLIIEGCRDSLEEHLELHPPVE